MTDIEIALLNPSSIFKKPRDVLEDNSLTHEEKIDILRRWSYDEREILVAEEENMLGGSDVNSPLSEIVLCLLELGVDDDEKIHPPTKQG